MNLYTGQVAVVRYSVLKIGIFNLIFYLKYIMGLK